jgi:hypothetical protein
MCDVLTCATGQLAGKAKPLKANAGMGSENISKQSGQMLGD